MRLLLAARAFPGGTLLDGRSTRLNQRSTGSPSAKQPSVLGSWLDFSIHHFRSELQRLSLQTWGTFTPGYAQLLRAHQLSAFAVGRARHSVRAGRTPGRAR